MNKVYIKYIWWLFFVINLLVIFALWWNGSKSLLINGSGQLIAIGRITGLLGEFCLALMLLFIGRVGFLEPLFGHDQLNKWHRYLGYGVSLFLLGHPIFLVAGYSVRNNYSWSQQFLSFINEWDDVFPALVALVLLVVVILFSIPAIKRLIKYEQWHGLHLLTYVAFIIAIGHQTSYGDFNENFLPVSYWYVFNFGCLGLLILYRWLRPLFLFNKHRFNIDRVTAEGGDVYSIYIKGNDMGDFKFKAGQFANLIILDKGFIWPHPFSFSSQYNGEYLRFTIKGLGDFSKKIGTIKNGTKVIIDGPLGRFVTEEVINDKFLLIAGGVGVTPIMALSQSLAKNKKDLAVIYAVKTENDLVFEQDLIKTTNKYFKFLSCQASEYIKDNCYGGYLDLLRLERLVADYKERDIYICGPAPMMSSIVKILRNSGVSNKQIHFEKFGY